MILQALTRLFEDLVERGEIARPGWSPAKISFALCIDENGALTQVVPQMIEKTVGKKTVLQPRIMTLPTVGTRAGKVTKAGFLWDNASYILGIDDAKYFERAAERFESCKELHHKLLDGVQDTTAQAILAFLDSWDPCLSREHPLLTEHMDELLKGGNLVFRVNSIFAQDVQQISQVWDRYYGETSDGMPAQCLITGKQDVPEPTHPLIKGVVGAQSSGAALVSFNAPAFCSYGKEQNNNAPVGRYAAFAYTAALNHLLAERENVHRIGDTTVVCWTEGADPEYNEFSNCFLFGDAPPARLTDADLHSVVDKLAKGLPCDELPLDLSRRFYILGLAPNAARLSVRFFYNSSFGELMRNVAAHHKRMEITGSKAPIMPLWALLKETVNRNTTDKAPSPVLAGAVARAIFTGTAYPAALLEATMLRIRAERNITPGRAAILKAYYLKNTNDLCPKEVLTVGLNENSTNIPYTLGRLFAVYEELQEKANPGINATIKDKFFNSASATPAVIFPILDDLAQKHLRKLTVGQKIYFDCQIGALKSVLGETNPTRLSLPERGSFNLGYYHQKEYRYTKKGGAVI